MSLSEFQDRFARALLDPHSALPEGLVTWNGSDAAGRFAVYRNTVVVSLVDALAAKFPVVRDLVGEDFFRAMARVFVSEQPPRSPIISEYGDGFPAFIAGFPPVAGLPYLADVAALDAAHLRAYHAADAGSAGPSDFAALSAEDLPDLRLRAHPSATVITSRHAVMSLWAAHQGHLDLSQVDPFEPEDALVIRPGLEVEVTRLRPGEAAFLDRLGSSDTLANASAAAFAAAPAFDMPTALHTVIKSGFAALPFQVNGACP
jgi:hypothetical protein